MSTAQRALLIRLRGVFVRFEKYEDNFAVIFEIKRNEHDTKHARKSCRYITEEILDYAIAAGHYIEVLYIWPEIQLADYRMPNLIIEQMLKEIVICNNKKNALDDMKEFMMMDKINASMDNMTIHDSGLPGLPGANNDTKDDHAVYNSDDDDNDNDNNNDNDGSTAIHDAGLPGGYIPSPGKWCSGGH